jgi:crotonobetainyl-CoA:carnitine CoA-transferase CaiB-like acyl-CoA transferase
MAGPLDGIRILDFTRWQQGPYATVMLSDLGADVVKVEEPRDGDLGRALGRQPDGWCAYFEAHDRNKRSITVDLRNPKGTDLIYTLVQEYDVVTDNYRPGVMKRLGLDYEALSKVNPRVITASASGFGPKGPNTYEPSFDIIGQGMGGIMVNQGGGPGERPMGVLSGMADQVGAMVFALGICSAITARERKGYGQHVDVSLLGSQIALQSVQLTGFMRNNLQYPTPQRQTPTFAYYGCSDGKWLTVGILDPKWWVTLARVLGHEEWCTDPRFATARDRFLNREAMLEALDAAFATRPRDEWLALLKKADIPSGPVNEYADVACDPQVVANEYITTLEHPSLGPVRVVNSPIRMSKDEVGARAVAPELGQHTEEVLLAAGYTWDDIEALRVAGAI